MATKLSDLKFKKRKFDPTVKTDREIAFRFLKQNTWKNLTDNNTCPFLCEWPYLNIPTMLKDKLLDYYSFK